jgi:hypothetical protein
MLIAQRAAFRNAPPRSERIRGKSMAHRSQNAKAKINQRFNPGSGAFHDGAFRISQQEAIEVSTPMLELSRARPLLMQSRGAANLCPENQTAPVPKLAGLLFVGRPNLRSSHSPASLFSDDPNLHTQCEWS